MDNLTHTLFGVLLGRAGLKRLTGRATAALVIASNLPDIDSFIAPLIGEPSIEVHRGFTHGIGGMLLLPFFTVAIILLWERLRPGKIVVRPGALLLVAFIGGLGHSLLDWLTSYGTRLLDPLSQQWFYGDAWFIVDPWVWIVMIVGLELSWRAERLGRNWHNPAIAVLATVCVYAALNLGISDRMVAATRQRLVAVRPTMVVANPEPLLFWRREIQWRNATVHGSGSYDLIRGLRLDPHVEPNGLDDPRLASAIRSRPEVRAFLFWSRMPVVVRRDGKAYLTDQRFSGPSSSRRGGPFLIPLG
ncbi:MAG: metal-dependent hydrolase [Sphingomicrobium sp.]